ncbi:MAG: hypothetical protein KDJ88_01265 [Bauldia sp.]|nr:hypothetical protein [Bauldia sp.]
MAVERLTLDDEPEPANAICLFYRSSYFACCRHSLATMNLCASSIEGEREMLKLHLALAAALALLGSQFAHASDCPWYKGIWYNQRDNVRWIVYFDDKGSTSRHNVFFERWQDKTLTNRIFGMHYDTNGLAREYVSIENNYYPFENYEYGNKEENIITTVPMTSVYEDFGQSNRELADWLVFADLSKNLYYANRTFEIGNSEKYKFNYILNRGLAIQPAIPPDSFRFLACRRRSIDIDTPSNPEPGSEAR